MPHRILPDLRATQRLAVEWTQCLQPGDLVLLEGGLGAGKTTLISALLRELQSAEGVASPTYALHHRYQVGRSPFQTVDHWDLYRIQDPEELDVTGFWEVLEEENNLTFIEWPGVVPPESWPRGRRTWRVQIRVTGEERRIEWSEP